MAELRPIEPISITDLDTAAHGAVFPPRDEWDIAAYDADEVVAGYREHRVDDPIPGPNRSPAYRWGWANRRCDNTRAPDGFEPLRHAFIELTRLLQ